MKHEPSGAPYCKVCLLPHDEETHRATLAIRKWHRWQVIKGLEGSEGEFPGREEIQQPQVA